MNLKKILSVFLTLIMVISMMPCQIWAAPAPNAPVYGTGTFTVNFSVEVGEVYDVTTPSGEGFTFEGETIAGKNQDYSFKVNINEGYDGSAMVVKVNENEIDANNGVYTVTLAEGEGYTLSGQATSYANEPYTFTVSVDDDIYRADRIEVLVDSEKVDIVPSNGIIFEEKTVTFYEGESVFNLLRREMKRNKIHMEFENTPIYNSAYIEGIANLYEFDLGELSGWMYKVNGWFPNYGCSRYQLKAGDKVEWVYTCDLGIDVGGNYSARNGS